MNMIFQRTSVRKYTDQKVSKEQIEMLLKAAMAAPSAMNFQPWEFVVVQERETLLKINDVHPYASMLKYAPLAIVVCADTTKASENNYWTQDCAAATQNIMLEATELGLGSVWLGTYPKEFVTKPVSELLQLPSHIMPYSIVSIGYPAGEVIPKEKFDPVKIHYEKWEG